MDHPEKELFNEVRNLKSHIEDAKNRILKVESIYRQKVEEVEEREEQSKRSESKLNSYLASKNDKLLIKCNKYEFPLFKSTLDNNIYKTYFLDILNSGKKELVLDIDEEHRYVILSIIRYGNLVKTTNDQDVPMTITIKDKLDLNMVNLLQKYFYEGDFNKLCHMLELENTILPVDQVSLFESFKIEGTKHSTSQLELYEAKDIKDILANTSDINSKAIFVGPNTSIIITLTEMIRIKSFHIKPFTANKGAFVSNTGYNNYTSKSRI